MDPRPTERFTSRVDDYIRYRPDYPAELIRSCNVKSDLLPTGPLPIWFGTRNLTRRFLDFGCSVYGVEPNAAMREAGERLMAGDASFTSVAGSAERQSLQAGRSIWSQPDRHSIGSTRSNPSGVPAHPQRARLGRARLEPATGRNVPHSG